MTKKIYDRKKISRLFDAGYNNHQIADIIGGNYRTVYDILLDMGKGPSRNSMLDIPKVKATYGTTTTNTSTSTQKATKSTKTTKSTKSTTTKKSGTGYKIG